MDKLSTYRELEKLDGDGYQKNGRPLLRYTAWEMRWGVKGRLRVADLPLSASKITGEKSSMLPSGFPKITIRDRYEREIQTISSLEFLKVSAIPLLIFPIPEQLINNKE